PLDGASSSTAPLRSCSGWPSSAASPSWFSTSSPAPRPVSSGSPPQSPRSSYSPARSNPAVVLTHKAPTRKPPKRATRRSAWRLSLRNDRQSPHDARLCVSTDTSRSDRAPVTEPHAKKPGQGAPNDVTATALGTSTRSTSRKPRPRRPGAGGGGAG